MLLLTAYSSAFGSSSADAGADAESLFKKLTPDLLSNEEGGDCSLRSDVWAYELEKLTGQRPSKILLLYTRDMPSRHEWLFHIAPAVDLQSEWKVFERANGIQSPLSLNAWMKELNGAGQECTLMSSVPESVIQYFNRARAGFGEYHPGSQSGPCMAFIVDADVSKPEEGFLNFIPKTKETKIPHSFEKAVESCATFNGRYRYGSPVVGGQRIKASAFRDETPQARQACEQVIHRDSKF